MRFVTQHQKIMLSLSPAKKIWLIMTPLTAKALNFTSGLGYKRTPIREATSRSSRPIMATSFADSTKSPSTDGTSSAFWILLVQCLLQMCMCACVCVCVRVCVCVYLRVTLCVICNLMCLQCLRALTRRYNFRPTLGWSTDEKYAVQMVRTAAVKTHHMSNLFPTLS